MTEKMEIVFFNDLGFGWLIQSSALRQIRDKDEAQHILIQRSLAELLRRGRPG